jgi:hypothetical protein
VRSRTAAASAATRARTSAATRLPSMIVATGADDTEIGAGSAAAPKG